MTTATLAQLFRGPLGPNESKPYAEISHTLSHIARVLIAVQHKGAPTPKKSFWNTIKKLGWRLKSDGPVEQKTLAGVLAGMVADKSLQFMKVQFELRVAKLKAHNEKTPDEDLYKVVALGSDMCCAALKSPEILAYAINDAQPINLKAEIDLALSTADNAAGIPNPPMAAPAKIVMPNPPMAAPAKK